MHDKPQAEHQWLEQLVGEWKFEFEMVSPNCNGEKSTGVEVVRSIGGMWVQGEAVGAMPGGATATNLMTLGFDLATQKFVGSFVSSAMSKQWVYEGTRDASGNVLTLETTGPSFTGDGKTVRYHDIVEIKSPDYRTISSQAEGPAGEWTRFMVGHYHRIK